MGRQRVTRKIIPTTVSILTTPVARRGSLRARVQLHQWIPGTHHPTRQISQGEAPALATRPVPTSAGPPGAHEPPGQQASHPNHALSLEDGATSRQTAAGEAAAPPAPEPTDPTNGTSHPETN